MRRIIGAVALLVVGFFVYSQTTKGMMEPPKQLNEFRLAFTSDEDLCLKILSLTGVIDKAEMAKRIRQTVDVIRESDDNDRELTVRNYVRAMIDAAYIQSNGKLFSGTYTDGWGGVRAIVDSGTIGGVQNNRRFVTVVVNANAQENEIRRLRLVFTCHGKGQLSLSTVNQDN